MNENRKKMIAVIKTKYISFSQKNIQSISSVANLLTFYTTFERNKKDFNHLMCT